MDVRVTAVMAVMRKSIGTELSVDVLSRKVNISPGRLRQLFKRETGQSPMQFLRKMRLQQVEQLLGSTYLSIKEIAFLSGFKDVSHFVRDFKKQHGVTPSTFRQLGKASTKGADAVE